MTGNLIFALVFLATFAAIIGGAALIRSYANAAKRIESERIGRMTRRAALDGGRFIGGSDKPGDN
jgi:hypothetical protein